jgi:hypothetical protein
MKKCFILLFLVSLVYVLCFGTASASAYDNPITKVYGIGYSIDAGDCSFADSEAIKVGSPILDESWLATVPLNRVEINSTEANQLFSTSFREVSSQFSQNAGSYVSISGYDLFPFGLAYGFNLSHQAKYQSYYSHYYYYKYLVIKRYSLSLPNYSSNLNLYKQHLHPDFLNYIIKLNNGQMTYNDFIRIYGTHVIANAIFGGRLELFYSVLSNEVVFNSTIQEEIKTEIESSIIGFGDMQSSSNFKYTDIQNLTTHASTSLFRGKAIGGTPFDVTQQNSYSTNYANWMSSINDNEVVVGYGQNGLIPLYLFVPDNYSNVAAGLKQAINTYLTNQTKYYSNLFKAGAIYGSSYATEQIFLRSEEYTITDSGRFKQKYDEFSFYDLYAKKIAIMKLLGYKKVNIKISMQVREVDDGYQYVFAYNGRGENDTLLKELRFEHTPGKKDTQYRYHDLTLSNIDLSQITDKIVLRYGASGNFEDTWKNRNLTIQLVFRK